MDKEQPPIQLSSLNSKERIRVIKPCWPKLEGGMYDGGENKRLDALRLAMELGADYVDVQLQVAYEFYDSIRGKTFNKTKVIVSSHNYQLTPSMEDLGNLVARIQATGADIVKIATTALDITDVARMFQIMVHSQNEIVLNGIGESVGSFNSQLPPNSV
ncbi:hypothetical protein JHK82_022565 [Glycine max]|nr:hypothetical protein JHK82_022565 [Glycine max]